MGITALGIALSGEIYMCRPKRLGTALAQVLAAKLQEIDERIAALQALRQTLAERVATDCPLQARAPRARASSPAF